MHSCRDRCFPATSVTRKFLAALLICILPSPVAAQGSLTAKPVRVRLTGPDTYQVPGVIEIQRDRISGRPIATTDHFVQFNRSADGHLLSVPRPRQRVTGNARAIADGLLEFIPDGESERLYVPLDGVEKIEVGREVGSRSSALAGGVAAGITAFHYTMSAYEHISAADDYLAPLALGAVAGIIVGQLVAHRLHGEKWRVVSLDELGALLAPPNPI